MRSFWNGSLSFGLVSIPVNVQGAVKPEKLVFHFLHEKDLGRVHNEKVCSKCGETLTFEEVVRGYEYAEDRYTPLNKKELDSVNIDETRTIEIQDFVEIDSVDPIYFDKPYYLIPEKKGLKPYHLLREALNKTKVMGIAKVIFHTQEHLVAVRAVGEALMLEVLHFPYELKKIEEILFPQGSPKLGKKELEMAQELVERMSAPFEPEKYKNSYRENLNQLIKKKIAGKPLKTKSKASEPDNVIDIMSRLKASLERGNYSSRKKIKSGKKNAS